MHIARRIAIIAVLAFIAGPLHGCGGDKAPAATAFPDSLVDTEVVATVNGHDITGRDLKVFTLVYQPNVADSLTSRLFNLGVLNGYIDRSILYQEAVAGGTAITDSTHAWFVNRFIQSMGGKERLETYLGRFGISRDELEEVIRRDLMVRSFIDNNVAADVNVTEEDARAYYDKNPEFFTTKESVHARHIIVRTDSSDTPEQRAEEREKIDKALARVRSGEEFQKVAAEASEGPSAKNGGDLGYFTRADMVQPFADVAFSLEPGQVSDVVETRFGFHIIKVVDHRDAGTAAFEDVKDRLVEALQQRRVGEALENHLKRTRSTAIIDPKFDVGGLTQRESTTFTR